MSFFDRFRAKWKHPDPAVREAAVPGIADVLNASHDAIAELQRRILRIIAVGIGCHESYFDKMLVDLSIKPRDLQVHIDYLRHNKTLESYDLNKGHTFRILREKGFPKACSD